MNRLKFQHFAALLTFLLLAIGIMWHLGMTVTGYVGSIGLYFDWRGILLGAIVVVLACFAAVALYRRRWGRSALVVLAIVAASIATASQVWLAGPAVWVGVSAHYASADPVLRKELAADLRRHWLSSDEVRVSSWIVLAERWGLCHSYWPQSHCVQPSGERLPMGLAREHLADIVRGA